MKYKDKYIELSSTIVSVKTKEQSPIVQISDAGATLYLTVQDWKLLKQYVDKQLKGNS